MLLDRGVVPQEAYWRVFVGGQLGEHDQVADAGPVSVYVAPSWPASVSVTAATSAISRTSIALIVASPIGA